MKKTILIKGFLVILLSVVLLGTTGVYAASADDEIDDFLMNFSSSNTTTSNTSNTNSSNTNSSVANNTSSNTTTNTNTSKTNTNSNTNKTNTNSSVYNNTNSSNLPKTGVEDSIPTMVLVVVFAISAIYAFKKIKEYNV